MGLIKFVAMPSEQAQAYRNGAADAYGMSPERRVSDGSNIPCRHCLRTVPEGRPYLILAYRPFPGLQPYAETGPIFLCAEECERAPESDVMPGMFRMVPDYIVRGYGYDDRIVYGTGAVTPKKDICTYAHMLLQRDDIAYLHMRSARNNCYQVRIDRA
ncbi:uncharacterized protein DUF1203 [Mesorhizobium sp. J18]|uniref:DUF1203 domain-containing protein n=1 Tax=Mesorhizobium sp. J18 TaxID=935263 RepID=UPI00119A372A|nr:DUF1203 domain-containing protein [Mesorhizobium sp. J18]TWG95507.1 uncharacterized protein DUF1203 [Mesorhizobium sp. J18]